MDQNKKTKTVTDAKTKTVTDAKPAYTFKANGRTWSVHLVAKLRMYPFTTTWSPKRRACTVAFITNDKGQTAAFGGKSLPDNTGRDLDVLIDQVGPIVDNPERAKALLTAAGCKELVRDNGKVIPLDRAIPDEATLADAKGGTGRARFTF